MMFRLKHCFLFFIAFASALVLAGVMAYFMLAPLNHVKTVKPVLETSDTKTDIDTSQSIYNELVPHKALYEVDLVSSTGGSRVIDISGKMFFKWEATCDAWITDHRFKLIYEYADSPAMHITSDFSTFEPFDGDSFDFTSRRKRDGDLYEEIRGRAEIYEDGSGKAIYTKPEDLAYKLEKGTLFPMAHTIELIKHINEGKKFYSANVFDGSDEEGPVLINSFIGEKINALANTAPSSEIDGTLVNTPAYKIRMAFFPLDSEEASSDYEMSLVFHDNGIISDMMIDYDDFTVSQKLLALEKLDAAACDNYPAAKN
jgi:hypothetical protein